MFHAWRSFYFDENTEAWVAYVTCIKQVATLLGYGTPQVLEAFKNILPTRLYGVLFPIEDLRIAVETAKRMFTKEKIDRQLSDQSFSTPFMNVRNGNNGKKVYTFDMQDRLDEKIDNLAPMMRKLTAQCNNDNKPFKHKIYQGKSRGQIRNYHKQGNY